MVVVFTPQESADTTDTANQLQPTQPVYHPLLWEETAASQVVTAMTGKLVLCTTEERSVVLRDLVTERLDLVEEVREQVTGELQAEGTGAVTWMRRGLEVLSSDLEGWGWSTECNRMYLKGKSFQQGAT